MMKTQLEPPCLNTWKEDIVSDGRMFESGHLNRFVEGVFFLLLYGLNDYQRAFGMEMKGSVQPYL